MTIDSVPDTARRAVSPKAATKLPGAPKDTRTIIRWLTETETIRGYIQSGAERNRYKIYADQFPLPCAPQAASDAQAENDENDDTAALRTQVAELRTENRVLRSQLVDAQAKATYLEEELNEAKGGIRNLHAGIGALMDATEELRLGAAQIHAGAGHYQNANENMFKVVDSLRSTLAQYIYPTDLSDLPGPTPES
ncbi:hypothetical protein AWB85_21735 [Mycobacteroides immunogenum]|uniref:Uncharacterized protein n=1 Tax=Mycobacteroides immunogenum TaxID=83262 RepID=A0A179VCN1_9MYCO|nr:hypothetical protein [Mycobacteroides immunogenum]OAT69387.1 hypothetical protein AWB85_21735 [Mycobacteroides immunogenum]